MATFDEHIRQAHRNLSFLSSINGAVQDCVDWQVTVCFYTALHLVNAHLSHFSLQYRRHVDVKDALNPQKLVSVSKLPEDEYISYVTLQMLSRRSRYLVNEKDGQIGNEHAFYTYEVHLSKALRHLDRLIKYFQLKYGVAMPLVKLQCEGIKAGDMKVLQVK